MKILYFTIVMKGSMLKEVLWENMLSIKEIDIFASYISNLLKNRDVFILKGNLGFGKTTLVRAILKFLDSSDIVTSPSFTLINEYNIILDGAFSVLRHIDLYRLSYKDELDAIGFDEIIYGNGISMIEWGDKFIEVFDFPHYIIEIEMINENVRLYRLNIVR